MEIYRCQLKVVRSPLLHDTCFKFFSSNPNIKCHALLNNSFMWIVEMQVDVSLTFKKSKVVC